MKQRRIRPDATWAFPKSTENKKNLCAKCTRKNRKFCPRNELRSEHKNFVAIRCSFFRQRKEKNI